MTLTHATGQAFIVASSHNGPWYVVVPIVAAVVIAKVVHALVKRRSPIAGEIVVRCSRGHVFRTVWSPWGSLTSIRLGFARFQHCPVGDHWALVRPVNETGPTDDGRHTLEHDR